MTHIVIADKHIVIITTARFQFLRNVLSAKLPTFYSIFVEQPTICSPFVAASLTMTTNLLPLTLSRPNSSPLQLSFEEAPVTHTPSSSFPYFLT